MTIVQDLPGFDYPPFLIPQRDGCTFAVWEEVTYTGTQGDSWTIPEAFKTDFTTVPAAVSWAVPKMGAYTLAAVVHDVLCEGLNDWHRAVQAVGREYATRPGLLEGVRGLRYQDRWVAYPTANAVDTDAIFYKIARDYGVDVITANLLWVGVRWGALANPARRGGFMQTFWPWLGLSLAFAPVLLPASLLAVGGRLVLRAASAVVRLFRRNRP